MSRPSEFNHIPVLYHEVIEALDLKPEGIYVDGTLGGGGHTEGILQATAPTGRLIGIDRDAVAIRATTQRLQAYAQRFTPVHDTFHNITHIAQELSLSAIDGGLLDLGVSSVQFDTGERGFSYRADAPLDMRMDQRQALTAQQVVNTYSQQDLTRILYEYGEERWAARIVKLIIENRPVMTTGQLVNVIDRAIPLKVRRQGGHPARRTFQALRIEVNQELEPLPDALKAFVSLLKPGGRLAVITFHSLEDRLVKNTFRQLENPCTCPPSAPVCICGQAPQVYRVYRKPVVPSEQEVELNPRARSAKLRVVEKL